MPILNPCRDCGAGRSQPCDEECASSQAIEHELVLAEIDAWDDYAATTYLDERWSA